MANNCLVTTLKASVNNDNLPVWDAVRLNAETSVSQSLAQDQRCFRIKANYADMVTVEAIGGYICDSDGTNQVSSKLLDGTEQNVYYTASTTQIIIKNKTQIRMLNTYTSGTNLNSLMLPASDIIGCTTLTFLTIGGHQHEGKLVDYLPLNSALRQLVINTTNIVGEIKDLKNCTQLYSLVTANSDYITGELADIASYHVAGDMYVQAAYQTITCNGEYCPMTDTKYTFDGQGGVVKA